MCAACPTPRLNPGSEHCPSGNSINDMFPTRSTQDTTLPLPFEEMVCDHIDWIHVTKDRLHWQAVVTWYLEKAGNFLSGVTQASQEDKS